MKEYTVAEDGTDDLPQAALPVAEAWGLEAEHVKTEFRERLAALESLGLFAAGVQAILLENGFGRDLFRGHCGCAACARRCAVCADTAA